MLNRTSNATRVARPIDYLLVLTACIRTRVIENAFLTDPELRLRDYEHSLTVWLEYPDPRLKKILFIENSGADLSTLRKIADRYPNATVEFASLNSDADRPEGFDYGFSELMMLDQGLAQSQLRNTTSHMVKVTGRLMFPKMSRLLDRLPKDYSLAVDSRLSKGLTRYPQRFTTTQAFMASHGFYDKVLRYEYLNMRPHSYPGFIEHVFFERLYPLRNEPGILMRFPVNLDPVGKAAHWGKDYHSWGQRTVSAGRAVARVLFPNFWI